MPSKINKRGSPKSSLARSPDTRARNLSQQHSILAERTVKKASAKASVDSIIGRPGLSSLNWPIPYYSIDLATHNGERFFETVAEKQHEDLSHRAPGLQTAIQLTPYDQAAAGSLAGQLVRGVTHDDPPASLASALYMRDVRLRVTGAVWQLHDELEHLPRSVFTLIGRGGSLSPEQLQRFDVRRFKRALRSALNRAGAGKAEGALIVILHGEWDETTGRYQLHWHGWAAGGMIEVVRRLKLQRTYISTEKARANDTDGVRNRVVISRKPIMNPAYRLSYMVQSFWPSRPTGMLAETPERKDGRFRVRGKRRIPEPQHSQLLIWLHQWRIEDVSLLMNLGVVQGRLRLSKSQDTYTNGEA